MMRYPGGKGKNYQHLINLIPPHRVYIETHLGGGAVLRHKKPAIRNIGIDIDARVISRWKEMPVPQYELLVMDATKFLESFDFQGDEFIYCDPPYLHETRRKKKIYRYEYTKKDHVKLLNIISKICCNVMISGYPSGLYNDMLRDWAYVGFPGSSHIGKRKEGAWMNFSPKSLHDYRFLGNNFRERERIKRKVNRWKIKATALPEFERQLIISSLVNLNNELCKKRNPHDNK